MLQVNPHSPNLMGKSGWNVKPAVICSKEADSGVALLEQWNKKNVLVRLR